MLVFDNIDRNEETLSGGGTTHRVNRIIIQKAVIGPQLPPKDLPSIAKEHQRSISLDIPVLPTYIDGKRPEPPILPRIECSSLVKKETADRKTLIWLLSRKINSGNQVIPSWTGFNIRVQQKNSVIKDNIGYLNTIDSPATSMNAVFEILTKSCEIKNMIQGPSIIVVFDQAIYAKGVEIIWKHEQFQSVIPRMGAFHTTLNLLTIISQRFGNAGLRDIVIESGIIKEASIKKVLEGPHCNRAI